MIKASYTVMTPNSFRRVDRTGTYPAVASSVWAKYH